MVGVIGFLPDGDMERHTRTSCSAAGSASAEQVLVILLKLKRLAEGQAADPPSNP